MMTNAFKDHDSKLEKKIRREVEVILSHELKTPLTSIFAYSELLIDNLSSNPEETNEENLAFSKTIYRKSRELMRFIDNVLHISILEINPGSYHRGRVNLSLLMKNTVSQFKKFFELRPEDRFEVEIADSITVIGNEKLLNDMVFEILANAFLYRKQHSPLHITFSLKSVGKKAVLSVSDNGIGIRGNLKERIFDKFFRIEGSDEGSISGLGVGLTLVQKASTFMAGKVSIESAFKKGTTVTLTFPLKDEGSKKA